MNQKEIDEDATLRWWETAVQRFADKLASINAGHDGGRVLRTCEPEAEKKRAARRLAGHRPALHQHPDPLPTVAEQAPRVPVLEAVPGGLDGEITLALASRPSESSLWQTSAAFRGGNQYRVPRFLTGVVRPLW